MDTFWNWISHPGKIDLWPTKKSTFELLKSTAILALFFVLPMIPWIGKNLSETGQFSVEALLNGKKATPVLKIEELQELINPKTDGSD